MESNGLDIFGRYGFKSPAPENATWKYQRIPYVDPKIEERIAALEQRLAAQESPRVNEKPREASMDRDQV